MVDLENMPIVIGDEHQYKVVLEDVINMDSSFFRDVYKGASENVLEIIESRIAQEAELERYKNSPLRRFVSQRTMNNMIGFMGERGTGKTSAMLSFAAGLERRHGEDTVLTLFESTRFNALKTNKSINFQVMDVIDPTLINDNESIVQVIVATLFQEAKQKMKVESEFMSDELITQFERVFKCLKNISHEKVIEKIAELDVLEGLNELASSTNLRKELEKLIECYMVFNGKCKDGKNFLVIPIDDMDLNIHNTERMIEEIRKYLMLPNVIILVAAKFEQLVDSMEKAYLKEYEALVKNNVNRIQAQSMAIRYLEKLLPTNRKNHMPNLMMEA